MAYPDSVDVVYSYRRQPYTYPQWIHNSGVAFVQILGGVRGFLFLTNRLMAPSRFGPSPKAQRPAAAADDLRDGMVAIFSDPEKLQELYDEALAQLQAEPVMEDPPPLAI